MPWNEPGRNGNNNDPWGNRKENGPPDLDKFFANLLKKFRFLLGGQKNNSSSAWQPTVNQSTGVLIGLIVGLVVIIWFISGFFIVNAAEEAVILRFGKYSETLQPGLHWFARFIDTKYLLDVKKIYSFSLEGDFITKSAEQNDLANPYVPMDATKKLPDIADQSKNLVNVELNVQYRISNPLAYLFGVVDPDSTIKEVTSGALSDMVGQMKLDEVLTTGRENLSSGVLERVKRVLAPYQAGLEVIAVTLRKVQAPDQVRAAFNDVNRADQDKATYIQQAQAYASKVVPLAQGVAARILADARGYQQQVVLTAQANIAKYDALLKVYASAPEVTRERLYLETMESILKKTSKILVDVNSGNNLIYLPLDKLMGKESDSTTENSNDLPRLPRLAFGQTDSTNVNASNSSEIKNDSN